MLQKMSYKDRYPMLKKKYNYAEDFAKANFKDIFPAEKIKNAAVSSANYFANAVLVNNGNLNFTVQALPWEAQLTSYRDAAVADVNNDDLPDIILAGNYYNNTIHAGRSDADYGTILVNRGKGNFICESMNGLIIKGEVRRIRTLKIGNELTYILAKNNDTAAVLNFLK